MTEIDIPARADRLDEVLEFVDAQLEETGCPVKVKMQLALAVEEIFVNIARYAYGSKKGKAVIRAEVSEAPSQITVTFTDQGEPYDPLSRDDPDITLTAEERKVGGLGIYLVKKNVDQVSYRYQEGKNILTIKKSL